MKKLSKHMRDEVIELLKLWFYLKTQYMWPEAIEAIEDKANEILALSEEEWEEAPINNASLQ